MVATAAVRSAKNRREFELAVEEESGLPVRVLSEEEEARLAFLGATRTFSVPLAGPVAVIDVGGGSTEVVVGTMAEGASWSESFRIGSAFLADSYLHSDPPAAAELTSARLHASGMFEGLRVPEALHAVATGGSANALRRLVGAELGFETLERAVRLAALRPAAEVAKRFELDPERVRVLPAGALIFEELMTRVGLPLSVSKGGVREGVIIDLLTGMGRRADGAERLLVVHAQRPEQADGAERLVREPVGRADERELAEAGRLELVADASERPAQAERLREHVEQRRALLERVDQAAVGADLLRRAGRRAARPRRRRRAAGRPRRSSKAPPDRVEKRAFVQRQARLVEGAARAAASAGATPASRSPR